MPDFPILRGKLRRPPTVADHVDRPHLRQLLEQGSRLPLTLLSAPAGYGKTALVAHWLSGREGLSAWLTLDGEDSEPLLFVRYLIAAVRSALPEACPETVSLLHDANLAPPLASLAISLSNDLGALPAPLVLVLDNYHRINSPTTHALVDGLLAYPASELRLVLIARRQPPLSLGVLRVCALLCELHLRELRFSDDEVATLLKPAADGWPLADTAWLTNLQQRVEGWPAGVRLLLAALHEGARLDELPRALGGWTPAVRQYFNEEVLARAGFLPAPLSDLLRTSILQRFCRPLCEAVCGAAFDGQAFTQAIADGGLLCAPVDEHGEWHRYHPLFREFLQRQLIERHSPAEIAIWQQGAADWFEAHGLLMDAVPHALAAGGPPAARRLLVRHRNLLINREQRYRLARCLQHLPPDTLENDAELLLMKAWLFYHQGRHLETPAVLDRIDCLLAQSGAQIDPPAQEAVVRGGLLALRSLQAYCDGQADAAQRIAEQALQQLPGDRTHASVTAHAVLAGARQMVGDLPGARAVLEHALATSAGPIDVCQAPLVASRCFIEWMAGDLSTLQWTAIQHYHLGGARFATEGNQSLGRYFLALVQYQRNELTQAEATLAPALAPEQGPRLGYRTEISFLMSAICQALGQNERARLLIDEVCEHLQDNGDLPALFRAQAWQAELALRQGRLVDALDWARNFDPGPVRFIYRFFNAPHLTLARAWLAEGSAESRQQAAQLLQLLAGELAARHNVRFLSETLATQALLAHATQDDAGAGEILARALSLAQPAGFIRLFVDLGAEMAPLLKRLHPGLANTRYVQQLLAACHQDWLTGTTQQRTAVELTRREVKILKLLDARLSNPEISDQLCISRATVKRHTQNIYGKLRASNRRDAVIIARTLGLLTD